MSNLNFATASAKIVALYEGYVDATTKIADIGAWLRPFANPESLEQFHIIRHDCWAVSVRAYLLRAITKATTPAAKKAVAKYKALTIEDAKAILKQVEKAPLEKLAYDAARSQWSYALGVNEIVTPVAASKGKGNANAKRKGKAKRKASGATHTTDKPAAPKVDAPLNLTLPNVKVERVTAASELDGVYMNLRSYVIKVQGLNAKAYTGDKGAAYLALHEHMVKEITRIAAIK